MAEAQDPLVVLVTGESADRIAALASALEVGKLTLDSTPVALQRALPPGPRTIERSVAVLAYWQATAGPGSEQALARVLRSMSSVRDVVERRGPACELVWTGVREHGSPVRETAPVVDEMLCSAARSVLLVSYSVYLGAVPTQAVIGRLAEIARDGVEITILVDAGWNDGLSVQQVKQHWPSGSPRPHLYSFAAAEESIDKLHAKVLLVDGRDLLVTSANLTGQGMAGNLEFGLRVKGQPAVDAAEHFEDLIRSKLVTAVDW